MRQGFCPACDALMLQSFVWLAKRCLRANECQQTECFACSCHAHLVVMIWIHGLQIAAEDTGPDASRQQLLLSLVLTSAVLKVTWMMCRM